MPNSSTFGLDQTVSLPANPVLAPATAEQISFFDPLLTLRVGNAVATAMQPAPVHF